MFRSNKARSRVLIHVIALGALVLAAAPVANAAPQLPPGASPSANPPEFVVGPSEQRGIMRWPRIPGSSSDEFSWWNFTAYGVPGVGDGSTAADGRRFVVVGALDLTRGPNGRLVNGRVLCDLALNRESKAFPHAWVCRTRVGLGPMNRRGTWWTQVAYADCPVDGSRCASESLVSYPVSGIMAPARPLLPRRRVRAQPSHLESSPAAAGGLGWPAIARVPVTCREMSADHRPGWADNQTYDCYALRVRLRTAGPVRIGSSPPRRLTLGILRGGELHINRTSTLSVSLDAGGVNAQRALAIERMLRARGRLRVIAAVSTKNRWDGKTRRARKTLVLHAPTRRPHGCRTGCLQP